MKKILAIDDQPDNLTTIVAVMNSYLSDYSVLTSLSGELGIEIARKELPDVILLDIIMPKMDGYETCKILKEDELTKNIPILIITAIKTDSKSKIKALEFGADAFLSKPFDPIELAAQVKVLIRIKAAENKLRSEKTILKHLVDERTIELTNKNIDLSKENAKRLKAENTLRSIATKFSSVYGISFFEKVCKHLCDTLDIEYAFVGEINNYSNNVNVKSIVKNDATLESFSFQLKETPSDIARHNKISSFPSNIQHLFPNDSLLVELNVESYVGIPLKNSLGDVMGIMVLMDIKPLEHESAAKTFLQIFSERVAAEMERLQSDDALRRSEENNRLIVENAPFCIHQLDLNGKVISINKAGLLMFGEESQSGVIGRKYLNEVGNTDRNRISLLFENAILGYSSTFEYRGNSGAVFSSSFIPIKDKGKIVRVLGITRDITEGKLAEANLIESEEKYRNLVDRANDGICIIQDNIVKYVNNRLGEIWGGSSEEILNSNFTNHIHFDELHKLVNFFEIRLKGEKNNSIYETILLNKKGESVHVELSAGLITYQGENADLVFIRDISDRKDAEVEIKKLSAAVEQSPSIIIITDLQGNIEYVNKKFQEVTGYSGEESKGKNPSVLRTGFQSDEFYKELWETIKTGKLWTGEFHNKKKNKDLFWETASIFPISDEKGNTTNFIKVSEDITERKLANAALKEIEEKYRKLIETTSEGFWLINSKSETVDVNQSLCNMLGYSKEEIIGKTPFDFVDDENLKIFKNQISQASRQQHRNYEILLNGKNNVTTPTLFNATSINDNSGKYSGSFAFVTDISNRIKSEQIQKALFNISNAVNTSDNLNNLISQIQIELGIIIDTTNFYVAMYNKENDEFTFPFYSDEKDNFEIIPAAKTLTKYVVETGKSLLANTALKKQFVDDGVLENIGSKSKVWLGVPLKIEDTVTGAFAVQSYDDEDAYDETDMEMLEFVSDQISLSIHRKQAVEELIVALEKATESDKLKTAFLQNVSHEIRTPMNGILGFASLLNNSSLSGAEQQSYVQIIASSGKRMLSTLNDIMDISMLETGQVKLNISNTDVNNKLDSLYDFFKPEVEEKGISFSYFKAVPNRELIIQTDKQKFYAILSNLIKNAVKYCHEGSIEFGYSLKGNSIEFIVKDTGVGIPADRQEAIFERFVQADIADVKVYEGSGLGLSISKQYVELLGGEIGVESVEGEGSKFFFNIPFNSSEDMKPDLTAELVENEKLISLNNIKILIAEDEKLSADYLNIVLSKSKSKILHAKTGTEAVEICKNNPDLDLILMDIKMPLKNGIVATTEIRDFNKEVVIIAQTAYAMSGDKQRALQAGCNDYISKPINVNSLVEIINRNFKK